MAINHQVLREYYSTLSRLHAEVSDILHNIKQFTQQYTVLEYLSNVQAALWTLARTITIGGRQIHDANIAATMIAYGITTLITNNPGDFRRFDQLIAIEPLVIDKA